MELIVDGVSHAYDARPVLSDVSLRLASGEIAVLLGPTGCGKSTLLRIAGGLERPDAGEARTRGRPPPASLHAIAYMFQDFALAPWRTVAGNVSLPLEHHAMSAEDRAARVAAALARVRLAEFANAYPRQLSGGMRQRTSIARALAVEPAILLMDEPLSALDMRMREAILADLVRLWTDSRFTALYVTHDIADAVRIGHSIHVLSPRPATILGSVTIAAPLSERREGDRDLSRARENILDLMRWPAAA